MDDFYAHDAITSPSAFAQWTAAAGAGVAAVIDLGCGNGRDAVFLADRGPSVTAVDSSSYAAAAARALAGDRQGIDVVEGDVLEHGKARCPPQPSTGRRRPVLCTVLVERPDR